MAELTKVDESQKQMNELREAAAPLIKYLNDNHHPHVTAIVEPTSVELLEGKMSVRGITEYLKD